MDKIKILIVDDNEDTRDALHDRLIFQGYSSDRVGDGQQAQKYLEVNDVQLIILDLMMPVMDGYTLLSWIRSHEEYDKIKIIVSSAKDAISDINSIESLGADGYVIKPYKLSELMLQINNCLDLHEDKERNFECARGRILRKNLDPTIE